MEWLLTRLFGPREWIVVENEGEFFAAPQSWLLPRDRVIKADLRFRAAQRLAVRLRRQAEDTPEPFL